MSSTKTTALVVLLATLLMVCSMSTAARDRYISYGAIRADDPVRKLPPAEPVNDYTRGCDHKIAHCRDRRLMMMMDHDV